MTADGHAHSADFGVGGERNQHSAHYETRIIPLLMGRAGDAGVLGVAKLQYALIPIPKMTCLYSTFKRQQRRTEVVVTNVPVCFPHIIADFVKIWPGSNFVTLFDL